MALKCSDLRLYLVTDPILCASLGVVETVQKAVAGGVSIVQLRDKNGSTRERTKLARALMQALHGTNVSLVINDDIEAAIAAKADGVHIGQNDGNPSDTRARIGSNRILGLSCETLSAVKATNSAPVDYLGLGPVFSTNTKADHERPIGMNGLATLVAATPLPTVAIGGINATHIVPIMATGTCGVSVISAICGQIDPTAAAREFFLL